MPGQSVPPYRMDQYNNRVDAEGYRVDSTGHRMPVQGPYYTPAPQAYSTQPVSRDEFGNRYDAQGNRIDASGRVIAMPASRILAASRLTPPETTPQHTCPCRSAGAVSRAGP